MNPTNIDFVLLTRYSALSSPLIIKKHTTSKHTCYPKLTMKKMDSLLDSIRDNIFSMHKEFIEITDYAPAKIYILSKEQLKDHHTRLDGVIKNLDKCKEDMNTFMDTISRRYKNNEFLRVGANERLDLIESLTNKLRLDQQLISFIFRTKTD
jgi:hypothetical protein